MKIKIEHLTKDLTQIDIQDILSCWQWKISDVKSVITISCMGDLFFLGHSNNVYWLQTDSGNVTKISDSLEQYHDFLNDEEKIDYWFKPSLIEQLQASGKILTENEVYSYKQLPVIGGEYSLENIAPTDISVHFAFSGQICEQIKDLPDGTKVNIRVKK